MTRWCGNGARRPKTGLVSVSRVSSGGILLLGNFYIGVEMGVVVGDGGEVRRGWKNEKFCQNVSRSVAP